jgi:tRNA 2-thiouridine synthesizing protein C
MSTTLSDAKRPLMVMQSAPYQGSLARAALDVALSYAVFSQQPLVLFRAEGVLALLEDQNPEALGRKSLRKVIDSMPLYDIEEIYVDEQSLLQRGLSRDSLPAFCRTVDAGQQRELVNRASHVLSF